MRAGSFLVIATCSLTVLFPAQPGSAKPPDYRAELVESGGRTRTVYTYRPTAVPADQKLPLLILLHGSGKDGTSLVREWRVLADKEGILLAGPDALDRSGWAVPADGPGFLNEAERPRRTPRCRPFG